MARATPRQVPALRAFCRRHAAFLQNHLDKHPGNENLSRGQPAAAQSGQYRPKLSSII
ncbi:hypothetical protein BH23PLA1_BH23PLA1_03110 [soil metagenome]